MKNLKILFCFLCFLIVCINISSYAADKNIDTNQIGTIPILHEGRIKPLDTFARITLKQIYNKETFNGESATTWLATALFDPRASSEEKIFRIENPNIRHALGVIERKRPLYAFAEISKGLGTTINSLEPILAKDKKIRTKDESDLLALHEAALNYSQILRSFSLLLPLNIIIPNALQNDVITEKDGTLSYLTLKKFEQMNLNATKIIIAKKGNDFDNYTEEEKKTVLLSYQLELLQNVAARNEILRIIPSPWAESKGEWFSPWSLYQSGQASPETAPLIDDLKQIAKAYSENNQENFDQSIIRFKENLAELNPSYSASKLTLEQSIQTLDPQTLSLILYGISFVLCLILLSFPSTAPKFLYTITLSITIGAVTVQAIDILARIYILARPPVSTLYESIIFVSFIASLIALACERKYKDGLFIFLASISALILGMLSLSLTNHEDTKVMLSAVLNTQFWLATHVICITLGYAWCVIVSIFAHLILLQVALKKITTEKLDSFMKSLHSLTLIALLLTAIGTILGGIWADQSWGRFWGWDPKENGALLIVLWLIWILHGGLAGSFSRIMILTLLSLTSIIVALAWIGVNLLGVGLHSYGFTEGLFWGLSLFIMLEILIVTLLFFTSRKAISNAS